MGNTRNELTGVAALHCDDIMAIVCLWLGLGCFNDVVDMFIPELVGGNDDPILRNWFFELQWLLPTTLMNSFCPEITDWMSFLLTGLWPIRVAQASKGRLYRDGFQQVTQPGKHVKLRHAVFLDVSGVLGVSNFTCLILHTFKDRYRITFNIALVDISTWWTWSLLWLSLIQFTSLCR